MNSFTVYDCSLVELPVNKHDSGNFSYIENKKDIPFEIKRIYYLYDVPAGETRGGHAHKELTQLIVAASGSFDVILFDGNIKLNINLNRPYKGLLVVPGIWRELDNFSSGSVCLVLASSEYDENDYIRDFNEFIDLKKKSNGM